MDLQPTKADLDVVLGLKHGDLEKVGWGPRMRQRFGYYGPDEHYEALVMKLVRVSQAWLDVGCGRYLFPNNPGLARVLVQECPVVVGVDGDATVEENQFVHQAIQCNIETFRPDQTFDLVTLRMVAEHVADPKAALESIRRLTRPGAKVVVFTINRWSPVSVVAYLVPFRFHHAFKRFFWKTEHKDTFPVVYRLNTRKALARRFEEAGFKECFFTYLDDCRTLHRFRIPHFCELLVWRCLKAVALRYPETCLLGVYERR
jgi:SAM-dependent methyltransferase